MERKHPTPIDAINAFADAYTAIIIACVSPIVGGLVLLASPDLALTIIKSGEGIAIASAVAAGLRSVLSGPSSN